MENFRDLLASSELDQGGWCDDFKRGIIHELVNHNEAKRCVEIGVYRGSSLLCFAEALHPIGGIITGIDPWFLPKAKNKFRDEVYEKFFWSEIIPEQETFENMFRNLQEILKKNNLSNTVSLVRESSENCSSMFEDESLDIIHIDGNHDEHHAILDLTLYYNKVKPGGYFIIDDTDWPGVGKAVSEILSNKAFLQRDFGNWAVFQK